MGYTTGKMFTDWGWVIVHKKMLVNKNNRSEKSFQEYVIKKIKSYRLQKHLSILFFIRMFYTNLFVSVTMMRRSKGNTKVSVDPRRISVKRSE